VFLQTKNLLPNEVIFFYHKKRSENASLGVKIKLDIKYKFCQFLFFKA